MSKESKKDWCRWIPKQEKEENRPAPKPNADKVKLRRDIENILEARKLCQELSI